MDKDATELIAQLYTRAGMVMEDASAAALDIAAIPAEARGAAIYELEQMVAQASSLITAARALQDTAPQRDD